MYICKEHFLIKIIVFLFLAFIVANSEQNALDGYPKFHLGLQSGLNIATMFGSEMDAIEEIAHGNVSPKAAADISVLVTYRPHKIISVQSGITITGKGFRILFQKNTIPNGEENIYMRRRITYLEIPFLFRAIFNKKKEYYNDFAFHLFAGPAAGLVISAKEEWYSRIDIEDFEGKTSKEKVEINEIDLFQDKVYEDTAGNIVYYTFDDFYRRADISLILGMTFEKRFTAAGFFVEFQYQHGLLNFNHISEKAKAELEGYIPSKIYGDHIFIIGDPSAKFITVCLTVGINLYFKDPKAKFYEEYIPRK